MINSKNNKIDANCEKNEKVKRPYVMIVNRDKREREIDCFDRDAISAHNIDFFDVVNDVHDVEKTNDSIDFFNVIIDVEKAIDSIEVDENEKLDVCDDDTDDIDVENVDKNETNEINEINEKVIVIVAEDVAVNFSSFVCFSRT